MKSTDEIKALIQLKKATEKFKRVSRPYSQERVQCSIIAVYKIKDQYLLKNPEFHQRLLQFSKLGDLSDYTSPNHKFREQELTTILEEELLRTDPDQNEPVLEIFFMQRSFNSKDMHTGQVSFPGGKVDKGEDDFQGGVREIKEEIRLDLRSAGNYYLGKLPRNWFNYVKRKKIWMISMLLFLSLENLKYLPEQPEQSPLLIKNMNLSEDEVRKAWWMNFNYFFIKHSEEKYFKFLDKRLDWRFFLGILHPDVKANIQPWILDLIPKAPTSILYYILTAPNKMPVWGTTLYLSGSMIQLSLTDQMEYETRENAENNCRKSCKQIGFTENKTADFFIDFVLRARENSLDMRSIGTGYYLQAKL